jgi:formamidopyrimidine-DNA glycosylase
MPEVCDVIGEWPEEQAMPELPEVEVCRRGLLPALLGAKILGAEVRQPKLRYAIPADLADTLSGQHILNVRRRGKYLLIDCANESGNSGCLIIHLGMSGNLRFVPPGTPPGKHDHVDILLAKQILRYGDPRRFGLMLWQPGEHPEQHPLIAVMGMEPLSDDFTVDWLYQANLARSGPIKPILMDSHQVVGIGNIYAAESLFRAGISPLRAANKISRRRYALLVDAIRQTLNDAIAAGGSSIRDYVHNDGSSGYFQIECAVYDRAGLACRRCAGPIKQIRQAGRSTFYCPTCQR